MLTATKLTKYYPDVRAVRNVSLTLDAGRIMALVGESGSGKSTLLNLLAGLADADAGEVRFNDERVVGPSEKLVPGHPQIRLVPQEYQLMPNVSVRENITFALRYYEKNYRDFRVNELLRLCRLTDVQHRLPRQVSGGEKQRTAIARAVADRSPGSAGVVLLLDEPFSHLDLPNRLIVRDLLFDLVQHDHMTCLFVTHDATDALSIADMLGILRDGKLVQLGSPFDVYRQPATAYAARMTGTANILKAKHLPALGLPKTDDPDALVCLRPEAIMFDDTGVVGTVRAVFFRGSFSEVDVELSRYVCVRALTNRHGLRAGQQVGVRVAAESVWQIGY
ncbi:ABC transporter ATP-binding protein [Spirosoma montaniterrae]|uniref:Fe3+/spermidine/putrescine ABC transporter ATP-binding protein n=1 Tax=Spirosoma montaniterrae TaxID=1178516 RepID=A0A1P9WUK4_9BACT|nr:ABC transporter ATP-binding protein [Spirosoma montaniterrae]AQG79020.1 Fe3+/spermidine/putrescine ABC transporter ATP-binding protein [Spirosoma montaniterrae]